MVFVRMTARPLRTTLIAGVVLVIIAIAHWGVASRLTPRAAPAAPFVPVVTGTVTTRDLPIWVSSIGTVQSLNVVNVRARVEGELQKVHFVEGQEVRAGDLLAQIDPRPFQAQLQLAEANLQKDQAQLAHARAEVDRYTDLSAKGFVSIQSVDALKVQAASLEATVLADRAMIETASLQLGFTRITTPIAGRVGLRQVDPGSMIRASDANGLVVIAQVRPIAVLFALPQDDLPEIVAQRAQRKLQATVYSRGGERRLAEGELAFLDNQVDTATGQIRIKAVFPNADGSLWPGQLISIRVLLRIERDAVVVPSKAVLSGLHGDYVYVVKSDHTVEPRVVKPGASADGVTALRSGVTRGEVVVLEGQSRLAPGSKVEPKQETVAPTAEAPS